MESGRNYEGYSREWLEKEIENISWEEKRNVVFAWLIDNRKKINEKEYSKLEKEYLDRLYFELPEEERKEKNVLRRYGEAQERRIPKDEFEDLCRRRIYHDAGSIVIEKGYSQCKGCKHAWFEYKGEKIYGHDRGFCNVYKHGGWNLGKPFSFHDGLPPEDSAKCEFYEKKDLKEYFGLYDYEEYKKKQEKEAQP